MAVDNKDLVYLLDPVFQIEGVAGKPVVAGHIEVFYAGTDVKYITWQNFDGTKNPFKIPLNNDGRAVILVEPQRTYDVYIYDSFNNLVCSRLNVRPSCGGDISISGGIYDGIDPIVVNNDVNLISANHVPLGVQDPLYFVQDDEEGCIIGLSGGTVPEGTMNESAFGYQDGQITSYNGSAFSAGNSYEAGSYVDIDGNTINVTGLQPSGEYVTSGDLDEYTKRTDFNDAISSLNSSKLDVNVYSSQSATFLTAHQSLEGYATEQWVENKGYLTAVPDNYATTGDLQTVSGEITALIPSTAGLATENWVTAQGYLTAHQDISNKLDTTAFSTVSGDFLTAHQSLDGLMSASLLEQSGGLITGYNGTAFAGQGGGVTGDYELSAGSGISIVDYPLEQKTVISVTAQGGNPEVEQAVIDNSATWNEVTAKADSTAIPSLDGYATEDWVTGQGYLTTAYNPEFAYHDTAISSIDNSALYDTSAHARINTLAGRISDLSSNKLDTTAFSDVSGSFLTAHQSLADYQTTAGMTAYLTTGDSAEFMTTAERSDYIPTGVSSEFYTTANTANYISEIPGTYLQNTDLGITDNKITAISGVELSAGGDVPEGVMVESGLEYNAVNEISAYNGSAIAQYGAEKQWLVHDDTLVHAANSAQYALGVNLSAVAQLLGIDETVLLNNPYVNATTTAFTVSEPLSNFKKIRFEGISHNSTIVMDEHLAPSGNENIYVMETYFCPNGDGNPWQCRMGAYKTTDGLTYTGLSAKFIYMGFNNTTINGDTGNFPVINKIYGIGRKS